MGEDAMIINKMSYERGFMQGNVLKQKIIMAAPDKDAKSRAAQVWHFSNTNKRENRKLTEQSHIQNDGLPKIGTKMQAGMVLCCSTNDAGEENITKYKDTEEAYVEQVNLI